MKECNLRNILYLHASAELFGSDYVLLSLLKSLDKSKFKPLVLLPFHGPLCEEFEKAEIEYEIHDLPVLRRQYFTPWGLLVFSYKMIRCISMLVCLVRRRSIYAIHTNTAAVWAGGIAAKLMGRPHYWQVMELVEKPRAVSFLMRKMVGLFSTRVFCISNAVRDFFIKANPNKSNLFQTVYHGVDRKVYDPALSGQYQRNQIGVEDGSLLVTFAGRFNAWKGQEILAQAMPLVSKRVSNVHFLFIGSCFPGQEQFADELKDRLDLCAEKGCRSSMLGFQGNLPEWLAASDIFILPSTLPEPNATVTIAAMAMELPVIGTNVGGTPESVSNGESGLLIESNNPEALANAIVELVMDDDKRRRMGENGFKRFGRMFSIENYCKTVAAAYE